ncbi:stage VI sporulation protein F [Aquibacillus saliphilus]|uniref:stage VI sporulation protein F n=1 Tax=Aquibacillus saliphilus TaxID=1909422 RepID=UPI001CF05DD4
MHPSFRKFGWKIGIPPSNISDLANLFQNTDFKDEYSAKKFIKRATRQTGMPISREMENMIVKRIMSRGR